MLNFIVKLINYFYFLDNSTCIRKMVALFFSFSTFLGQFKKEEEEDKSMNYFSMPVNIYAMSYIFILFLIILNKFVYGL